MIIQACGNLHKSIPLKKKKNPLQKNQEQAKPLNLDNQPLL